MAITIYRGTTPTLKCILPSILNKDTIEEIWMTFKYVDGQNCERDQIDYYYKDGLLKLSDNVISLFFTQEMTLRFKDHTYALDIRILLKNGTAIALKDKKIILIRNVLKDGVIGELSKIIPLNISDEKRAEFETTFNNIDDKFEASFGTFNEAVSDYLKLINKPSINGITIEGDKTFDDYNLQGISSEEIVSIWKETK